jgi:hypothetical protein
MISSVIPFIYATTRIIIYFTDNILYKVLIIKDHLYEGVL